MKLQALLFCNFIRATAYHLDLAGQGLGCKLSRLCLDFQLPTIVCFHRGTFNLVVAISLYKMFIKFKKYYKPVVCKLWVSLKR